MAGARNQTEMARGYDVGVSRNTVRLALTLSREMFDDLRATALANERSISSEVVYRLKAQGAIANPSSDKPEGRG